MVAENVFRKSTGHGFGCLQINQGTDNYFEGNVIVDWHAVASGHTGRGGRWRGGITKHGHSARMLASTDWKSEKWREKYPMVRDLMNGDDNYNYLVDNLRMGSGAWGKARDVVRFANRDGDKALHANELKVLKPHLVPWRAIPLDAIGPYEPVDP